MNIAIYARQSKFSETGDSIENQIKLCKEYADTHKYTSVNIYKDEGFSGRNTDRPEFKRLLEDARNKKFDSIICYKLDRISRNITDFSSLIDDLSNLNISFISIKEQFNTSNPMGRAMMFISSVFAQLERETLAERVKDNMYELARNGQWLGGNTPFGYRSCKTSIGDSNSNGCKYIYKLEQVPSDIDIIKLMFEKYIEYKSINKLHKFLLNNNIKGARGGIFDKRSISIILRNPVYAKSNNDVILYLSSNNFKVYGTPDNTKGILTYGKNTDTAIAAVSHHYGCIDSDVWLNVQCYLDNNKNKTPRLNSSNKVLLSGLLKCNKCGKSMVISYSTKKPIYYVCRTKKSLGLNYCSCKNLNSEIVEKNIISKVKTINTKEIINNYSKSKKDIVSQRIEIDNNISSINADIYEKEGIISSLIIELTKSSQASYYNYIVTQLETLNNDVLLLKNKIESLQLMKENLSESTIKIDTIVDNINKFNKTFDCASTMLKKDLLNSIISKIVWDSDTYQITIHYKDITTTQQFIYEKSLQLSEYSRSNINVR